MGLNAATLFRLELKEAYVGVSALLDEALGDLQEAG